MAIGEFYDVVIDCPDPAALAEFYRWLVGGEVVDADAGWVSLRTANGRRLSFQRVEDFTPPRWPGQEVPQQIHVDVAVSDLDASEAQVLEFGATKLHDHHPACRVYADPAGHPFCLVVV
ncbi:VOC family protein [Lentzea sp.]|uniref:VOC family protein n=1 Tax=Lentzea sp. TaxID=56099 RepID=UPI002BFFD093|nr:VOC family protein [Lentzea sp.]HUQ57596.1 VOC family protein [Lentzea sp.]